MEVIGRLEIFHHAVRVVLDNRVERFFMAHNLKDIFHDVGVDLCGRQDVVGVGAFFQCADHSSCGEIIQRRANSIFKRRPRKARANIFLGRTQKRSRAASSSVIFLLESEQNQRCFQDPPLIVVFAGVREIIVVPHRVQESFVEIGIILMEEIIPKRIRSQKIIAAVFKAVAVDKIFEGAVVLRAQKLKHCPLIRAYGLCDKFQEIGGVRMNRQKIFHVVGID